MRRRKLNQFYGLSILCLGIMLCFSRCETNEDIPTLNSETPQVQQTTEKITFSELPIDLTHNVNVLRTLSANGREGSLGLASVDESRIVKVTDQSSNTKYSIKFSVPGQPENVLYNLILGTNERNQETTPFVIKYTIENMDEVYANGVGDFSKMKGKISEYAFDSFQAYLDGKSTRTGRTQTDTIEPDPCAEYDNTDDNDDGQGDDTGDDGSQSGSGTTGGGPGGSGNGGDPGGHGDISSGGGEFENTDDTSGDDDTADCNINVWSNGETGEVFGITWSCSDGQSGSVWGRTASEPDCPGDGDVGINDGEDGPSCESFNYHNTTTNWHEAAVVGIRFHVYIISPEGIRYAYSQVYNQPVLFGAPSNLSNGGNVSAGAAAEISATALATAISATVQEFRGRSVSETAVDIFFKDRLKKEFNDYYPGGNVQFNSSPTVPITSYQTYAFIPDDCD